MKTALGELVIEESAIMRLQMELMGTRDLWMGPTPPGRGPSGEGTEGLSKYRDSSQDFPAAEKAWEPKASKAAEKKDADQF